MASRAALRSASVIGGSAGAAPGAGAAAGTVVGTSVAVSGAAAGPVGTSASAGVGLAGARSPDEHATTSPIATETAAEVARLAPRSIVGLGAAAVEASVAGHDGFGLAARSRASLRSLSAASAAGTAIDTTNPPARRQLSML
jgi:hypothetical protein